MHTSKLLEFTFSNQTYIASSGFVSRVYLADTKRKGLLGKLCNVIIALLYNLRTDFAWPHNVCKIKSVYEPSGLSGRFL